MASKPNSAENSPSFPSVVLDRNRPGLVEVDDTAMWNAKKGVLEGVIDNVMRKHGADRTIYDGFDEANLDVPDAAGTDVSIVGAQRANPPMTKEEALEIGTEIRDRWYEVARELPVFCDTVHLVPIEMARVAEAA